MKPYKNLVSTIFGKRPRASRSPSESGDSQDRDEPAPLPLLLWNEDLMFRMMEYTSAPSLKAMMTLNVRHRDLVSRFVRHCQSVKNILGVKVGSVQDCVPISDLKDVPALSLMWVADTVGHLLLKQELFSPEPRLFERVQVRIDEATEVNYRMRLILVGWMREVANISAMKTTLYQEAVNLVNLYLSKKQISRMDLQLLGAVCLKFKNPDNMTPDTLTYICANAFTTADVFRMEESLRSVVTVLNTERLVPTPSAFLNEFFVVMYKDLEEDFNGRPRVQLAHYYADLAQMDSYMLDIHPFTVAAAAIFLSGQSSLAHPIVQSIQQFLHASPQHSSAFDNCVRRLEVAYNDMILYRVNKWQEMKVLRLRERSAAAFQGLLEAYGHLI